MKVLVQLALLMLAPIGASGTGVDITWNDCVTGTSGTASSYTLFHCRDTPNREYPLMLQFKSPVPLPNFVAATFYVDLFFWWDPPGSLLPFWHFERGGCNASGLSVSDVNPATCQEGGYLDPWGGDGSQGYEALAAYGVDYPSPNHGWFVFLAARGDAYPIQAGENYFGFRVDFNNVNRAICAGCERPKALVLTTVRLESNDRSPAVDLTGPDKFQDVACINTGYSCVPPNPVTPVTWGCLKSMFR